MTAPTVQTPKPTVGSGGQAGDRIGFGSGVSGTNSSKNAIDRSQNRFQSTTPLTPGQQSIWDFINSTLQEWGLPSSLMKDVRDFITKGYSSDEISLRLQDTEAYKQRFAGNELRKKMGLSVLNPAQYIALEEAYTNTLRAYNLPSGFYDNKRDFDQFIGNDIDPTELKDRAQAAYEQYMAAPQAARDYWQQQLGMNDGQALAYILDPARANQVVQDRVAAASIGGAALQNGFNINIARAQQLQQNGVTLDNARRAYARIGEVYGTDQMIAHRFRTNFDQTQEENDLLLNDPAAAQKRNMLYASEQAQFRGTASFTPNALGTQQGNY